MKLNSYSLLLLLCTTIFISNTANLIAQNYFPRIYSYGGTEKDWGYSIHKTSDGKFVSVGETWSFSLGYGDFWMIKTDQSGNLIWSKTFGTAEYHEFGKGITEMDDSSLVALYGFFTPGSGWDTITVLKTDKNGIELWSKKYRGWPRSITHTSDDGILIAMSTNSNHNIIKLDKNGNSVWVQFYDYDISPNSIIEIPQKGFIMVGSILNNNNIPDIWIQKTDLLGNPLWTKIYGNQTILEWAYKIDKINDTTFVIAAHSQDPISGIDRMQIIKIDSSGNIIWQKLAGNSESGAVSGIVYNDSIYFLFGNQLKSFNKFEIIINQYNINGQGSFINSYIFDKFNSQRIEAAVIESDTTMVAIGGGDLDLIIFSFDPYALVTNINSNNESYINLLQLKQNYPNPFNPSTSIQYAVSSLQFVSLKVYDVLGNEVATLVNEEKPAGNYEVEWNASDFPSGIYFYQLKSNSFIETKKMIILK